VLLDRARGCRVDIREVPGDLPAALGPLLAALSLLQSAPVAAQNSPAPDLATEIIVIGLSN
jgi:hypothetical protein